jgi:hypothetical protein
MKTSAWKHAERRVARALGGSRVGPSGFNTADVTHPLCSVSVKYRKNLPAWALDCLDEARGFKGAGGKVALLVMLEKGMRIQDGLVVMRVAEFEQLYGALDVVAGAAE